MRRSSRPTGDRVLASASTVEADVRKDVKNGGNKAAARSSASASATARRRSASRRSRSTARATGTTAACRRWPTRPAKPA
jgi:hypothetical protein